MGTPRIPVRHRATLHRLVPTLLLLTGGCVSVPPAPPPPAPVVVAPPEPMAEPAPVAPEPAVAPVVVHEPEPPAAPPPSPPPPPARPAPARKAARPVPPPAPKADSTGETQRLALRELARRAESCRLKQDLPCVIDAWNQVLVIDPANTQARTRRDNAQKLLDRLRALPKDG